MIYDVLMQFDQLYLHPQMRVNENRMKNYIQ